MIGFTQYLSADVQECHHDVSANEARGAGVVNDIEGVG